MQHPILKSMTVMGLALMMATPAWAERDGGMRDHDGPRSEFHEEMKDMTPEQREAFMKERKAKWDAMSDAEKVKMIEERRSKRMAEMEKKWNSMSDAEKVKHVEEKMKHHKDGDHKKRGDGKHRDKSKSDSQTED